MFASALLGRGLSGFGGGGFGRRLDRSSLDGGGNLSLRLFSVLDYLSSDALAGSLDLLAEVVVVGLNHGLRLGSNLSDALNLGLNVLSNSLSVGGNILDDNTRSHNACGLGEIGSLAPNGVDLLANKSTRLSASAGSIQKTCNGANNATYNERTKLSHEFLLERISIPHYIHRALDPPRAITGFYQSVYLRLKPIEMAMNRRWTAV